jgi:prepilin-type N-terminal cleavage/methylation domain-containing protein
VTSPGFTLLETMVALVIASVTIGAVARQVAATARTRALVERLDAATVLAERSLEEMLAREPASLTPEDSADQVSDRVGVLGRRRRIEIGPRESLWHLTVEVTAPGAAPVVLHTLLRRPWT